MESVTRRDIERLARSTLARGLAPKTVRNVVTFLHSAFDLAVEEDWIAANPVAGATGRCGDVGVTRTRTSNS
jgi:hypothetical protein